MITQATAWVPKPGNPDGLSRIPQHARAHPLVCRTTAEGGGGLTLTATVLTQANGEVVFCFSP